MNVDMTLNKEVGTGTKISQCQTEDLKRRRTTARFETVRLRIT